MTGATRDFADVLVEFISSELAGDRQEAEMDPDTDLLGSGLLDSLAVMRLVTFIESRRQVTVPPADITIEHFMTVRSIVGYLESLEGDDGQQPEA